MTTERIDVLEVVRKASQTAELRHNDAQTAWALWDASAVLAELIEAARDCNEWLCRTDREGTAHQRNLAAALAKVSP